MLCLPHTITDQRIEPNGAFDYINSNIINSLVRTSNVQVNIKKTCKHGMTRGMTEVPIGSMTGWEM